MLPIQCEELRINHLISFLVVTIPYTCWFLWWAYYIEGFKWCLHFQFEVAFWRVVLRGILWRTELRLKGIEDFNMEHCLERNIVGWKMRRSCQRCWRWLGMVLSVSDRIRNKLKNNVPKFQTSFTYNLYYLVYLYAILGEVHQVGFIKSNMRDVEMALKFLHAPGWCSRSIWDIPTYSTCTVKNAKKS